MLNPATAPRQAVDDGFPSCGLHIAKAANAKFEPEQSEGHITIDSDIDRGPAVNLYLPRSPTAAVLAVTKEDWPEFALGSERILVVEDDESVREVAVDILSEQGYEIVEATNGKEATEHLSAGRSFDLLFTDVILPGGMNGVDVAEIAEEIQPNIKILLTTGYAETVIMQHAKLDPRVKLLKKPYRRNELLKQVGNVLGN